MLLLHIQARGEDDAVTTTTVGTPRRFDIKSISRSGINLIYTILRHDDSSQRALLSFNAFLMYEDKRLTASTYAPTTACCLFMSSEEDHYPNLAENQLRSEMKSNWQC